MMALERLDVYRIMETSWVTRKKLLKEFDPEFDSSVQEVKGPALGDSLRRIKAAGNWFPLMAEVRAWHERVYPKRAAIE